MPIITGNLVDYGTIPRPNLSPIVIFSPRFPSTQNAAVFFTRDIIATPDASGLFTVSIVNSLATTPNSLWDVSIKWLDAAGNFIKVDYLTSPNYPLVVGTTDGLIGTMLQTQPTALQVWIGETNNTAYGFWYQPSTAILRSNP